MSYFGPFPDTTLFAHFACVLMAMASMRSVRAKIMLGLVLKLKRWDL